MGKHFKSFFTILCIALCLLAAIGLMGCNLSVGEYETLTPLTEEEVLQKRKAFYDYQKIVLEKAGKTITDDEMEYVTVNGYYGTYRGFEVLNISSGMGGALSFCVMRDISVGGVYLGKFDDSNQFYLYCRDADHVAESFLSLEAAYENGTVTKADLRQIAYYARQGA